MHKPPCYTTHSPTPTGNCSSAPSAFPVLLPTGTLVLTKEGQGFPLPGALSLPNCGEEFKEVGLCTHLIQEHRRGNRGGKGTGETQHKPVRGVRNGMWVRCDDVAWKSYQHTLEMIFLVEGMVWKMAQSKVRVKELGSTLGRI